MKNKVNWTLGFILCLGLLFTSAKAFQPNGKPAHVSQMTEGVLMTQNVDEGWAIFQVNNQPKLIETWDKTLVVGKKYRVVDRAVLAPKAGYLHYFHLKEVG